MEKIRKKNIKEICKLVDQIIDGSDNKMDYKYISFHLNEALTHKISYDDIELISETVVKIAKTKNRIIRHIEKEFWEFVNNVPFQILLVQELDIDEEEELLSDMDYNTPGKKILSRLLGLTQEILGIKDDNSKGSDLRRSGSLRLIADLISYYQFPIAKELFVESINSKNVKEQYTALEGLENYYSFSDDDIEDDLIQNLDRIIDETNNRTVASICLQIQINAGLIDEMTALFEMDEWKDDHCKYL
jgi:hypothetical protein